MILVPGDTNTTLAAALTAAKLNIPLAHIEAGARSFDMSMPEEVNRTITDHVSNLLFAPTRTSARNLCAEGIPSTRVHLVGDTMVDALREAFPFALKLQRKLLSEFSLDRKNYVVVTAHRSGNVDDFKRLNSIVEALIDISQEVRVIFPVHPRTSNRLKTFRLTKRLRQCRGITLTKPVGYIELLSLLDGAVAVLTDSGGLQKEAYLLGVACVTMRNATEWPETLQDDANKLTDVDKTRIVSAILSASESNNERSRVLYLPNPFGDGKSSANIVDTILKKS